MRAVIQRVQKARVEIHQKTYSSINKGLLVMLGVENADSDQDIDWLAGKICRLRIFNDNEGTMNLSVNEINGEIMVVSQFTLHASTKKGNRPSYIKASKPDHAIPLYEKFITAIGTYLHREVQTGVFGAMMKVHLINDGPVTIIIDTKNKE
ncbi:MAG: D-tyrosyl-tRNA(Tyr) deacylase [Bacteroidales bacterium]|jgi:D-tyrosyl-tRNA(Tyr) deacylase|nr:D-tyrosyl-tRNA(Tyr) deacylase [Bacteroidales bacterium]